MNNTTLIPIIGFCGLLLMILASIAVFIYNKKVPTTLGTLKVSLSKKGTASFVAICILPFLLPISCFFRNWSPFIAIVFSFFGIATVAFGLKELIRVKQRGIYENGFIIGGSIFIKTEIDYVDFTQNTDASGVFNSALIKIQTKDRKIVQEILESSEDYDKIFSAVQDWGISSSK